jgi:hypothetical protein
MPKIHSYSEPDANAVGGLVRLSRQMRRKTAIHPRGDSPSRQGEERRRCRPSLAWRLRDSPAPSRRSDSDGPRSRESRGRGCRSAATGTSLFLKAAIASQSREPRHGWEDRRGPFLHGCAALVKAWQDLSGDWQAKASQRLLCQQLSIRSRVSSQLGTGFSVALTVRS